MEYSCPVTCGLCKEGDPVNGDEWAHRFKKLNQEQQRKDAERANAAAAAPTSIGVNPSSAGTSGVLGPQECSDKSPECKTFLGNMPGKTCFGHQDEAYMRENCPETCGVCKATTTNDTSL